MLINADVWSASRHTFTSLIVDSHLIIRRTDKSAATVCVDESVKTKLLVASRSVI